MKFSVVGVEESPVHVDPIEEVNVEAIGEMGPPRMHVDRKGKGRMLSPAPQDRGGHSRSRMLSPHAHECGRNSRTVNDQGNAGGQERSSQSAWSIEEQVNGSDRDGAGGCKRRKERRLSGSQQNKSGSPQNKSGKYYGNIRMVVNCSLCEMIVDLFWSWLF